MWKKSSIIFFTIFLQSLSLFAQTKPSEKVVFIFKPALGMMEDVVKATRSTAADYYQKRGYKVIELYGKDANLSSLQSAVRQNTGENTQNAEFVFLGHGYAFREDIGTDELLIQPRSQLEALESRLQSTTDESRKKQLAAKVSAEKIKFEDLKSSLTEYYEKEDRFPIQTIPKPIESGKEKAQRTRFFFKGEDNNFSTGHVGVGDLSNIIEGIRNRSKVNFSSQVVALNCFSGHLKAIADQAKVYTSTGSHNPAVSICDYQKTAKLFEQKNSELMKRLQEKIDYYSDPTELSLNPRWLGVLTGKKPDELPQRVAVNLLCEGPDYTTDYPRMFFEAKASGLDDLQAHSKALERYLELAVDMVVEGDELTLDYGFPHSNLQLQLLHWCDNQGSKSEGQMCTNCQQDVEKKVGLAHQLMMTMAIGSVQADQARVVGAINKMRIQLNCDKPAIIERLGKISANTINGEIKRILAASSLSKAEKEKIELICTDPNSIQDCRRDLIQKPLEPVDSENEESLQIEITTKLDSCLKEKTEELVDTELEASVYQTKLSRCLKEHIHETGRVGVGLALDLLKNPSAKCERLQAKLNDLQNEKSCLQKFENEASPTSKAKFIETFRQATTD